MHCAFDIETTRIDESAYMYIWQFQINDYTIIGRTWEEFSDLVDQFRQFENWNFIVWIANCGHEFQFMRKRFPITDLFAKETRQPLKFSIYNLEFREALAISGGNLSQLAKDYTVTQKLVGDLDYTILRNSKTKLTENELAYCVNDVKILAEFSEFMWNNYIDRGYIPLTKTGILRREVKQSAREWCARHHVKIQSLYNAVRDMYPKTASEYNFEMEYLFRGGYTHANNRYIGVVIDFRERDEYGIGVDFTSSYPFVMFNRYVPVSPFYPSQFSSENLSKYCCKFLAKFTHIHATTSHSIESKNKIISFKNAIWDNGRLLRADEVVVYLTELDFESYNQFYNWETLSVSEFKIARRGYIPKYLLDVLYKHYKSKNDLKKSGKGGTPEYAIAKSGVNSMFGLCCTRLTFNDITYDNDEGEWGMTPSQKSYSDMISSEILSCYFGVWITAQARRNELKTLYDMTDSDAGNDVIYSDTDSHKLTNGFFRPYIDTYNKMVILENAKMCYRLGYDMRTLWDIGTFDYESEHITRFSTLGAKRYLYEENGEIKQTISGLGKTAVVDYAKHLSKTTEKPVDPFDLFHDNMYIPPDFTGKLRACYGGDLSCDDVVCGEKMYEESSVALMPVEFTMKLNPEWSSLLIQLSDRTKRRLLYNEN